MGRCGDVTNIVLTVLPHGDLKLNRESLARESLDRRLQEVFRTRAYTYVFVIGDPATSFGEVANVVDIATKQVDHVAILTRSVAKMHTGQNGACIDPNLPPEYIFRPPR